MKTIVHSLSGSVSRLLRALALFPMLALLTTQMAGAQSNNVNLYTGSSTYTIPIVTPPGTNGMGPNLALTYSSDLQGGATLGDDWAGDGWRLTGLGYIERRGPNYSPSPTYDDKDTYVLNLGGAGEKLVYTGRDPASPTGYGGGHFSTQIDNYMSILKAGLFWVVTDKNGTRYYFGTTDDSRQYNQNSNGFAVFRYHLDRVEDTHGVFWTVSYHTQRVGDMYPKQIVYSQGPGLPCKLANLASCRTPLTIPQNLT